MRTLAVMRGAFDSIYSHGFLRIALCTPRVDVASPSVNLRETLGLARRAVANHAALVVFPELGLSAYSNEDLFHQDALLDAVEAAVADLIAESQSLPAVLVAGAPLRSEGRLFNCALVICEGRLLGVTPKTYLPNYREFYEKRQFSSGAQALRDTIAVAGQTVPFGSDLIFEAAGHPEFVLHAEICEDVWVPLPPSTFAALGGATVLTNLSASNVTIGKAEYRRQLCAGQSAKCVAAYAYVSAGYGESTTDLAWDGHGLVCENGEILAESSRFGRDGSVMCADVDLERLRQERTRLTSFGDCAQLHREQVSRLRRITFSLAWPAGPVPLERQVHRYPYVPSDTRALDERCREVYSIQVQGLARRLDATGIRTLVVGVSGGLDSTHALIVAVKTMDELGLPRANVLAVTMPGFATSARSLRDARQLMHALGTTASEIDIRPSARQMLEDIGHPFAHGEQLYDTTFENVQAGERTSHLFRLANLHAGLVVGTSDLSELALGFTTYGVGDHMAHYGVNGSVPKTLIRHLIHWMARSGQVDADTSRTLDAILAAVITPELVPGAEGQAVQASEAVVGPYALQDFNMYYITRFGLRPSKVAFLAQHAWSKTDRGAWPASIAEHERHEYDLPAIKHWLEVFLRRFFGQSQFKRSAMPNGPKVGSGGSLSPRSDWRAPSDARADVWIEELRDRVP